MRNACFSQCLLLNTDLKFTVKNMATFEREKLIPFMHVLRKIKACDQEQRWKALQQLPQIFEEHGLASVLTDIVFNGLCDRKFYKKIPSSLYDNVHQILPTESELELKDSIYESQLVELPVDSNEDKQSTNQEKKKLPLTLLRVPTDLQCNLFQFLGLQDLIRVQRVCRSLCIAARNPASLFSLEVTWCPRNQKYCAECYSRPHSLSIKKIYSSWYRELIGNVKWGHNVTDLYVAGGGMSLSNLVQFSNLKKCHIGSDERDVLLNLISSYDTLRELTLEYIELTNEVIRHILKFKNLEVLSLRNCGSNQAQQTDLIVLSRLREFTFGPWCHSAEVFQSILIGSQPEIINVESYCTFPAVRANDDEVIAVSWADTAIPAIRAVKHINIKQNSLHFISALSPLLNSAQIAKSKIFETATASLHLDDNEVDSLSSLSPIITLFACAMESKLVIECRPYKLSQFHIPQLIVQEICNAPHDTFNEIVFHTKICISNFLNRATSIGWFVNQISEANQKCESKHATVDKLQTRFVREVEKWVRPWLVFNVDRMKQIGLRKVDITIECSSLVPFGLGNRNAHRRTENEHRIQEIIELMTWDWSEKLEECWRNMDKSGRLKLQCNGGVTLSLRT